MRRISAGCYEYLGHTLRRERKLCQVGYSGRIYSLPRMSTRWYISPELGEHGPWLWRHGYKRLSDAVRAINFASKDALWQAGLELAAEVGRRDRDGGLVQLDAVSANQIAEAATGKPWPQLRASQQAELLRAWHGDAQNG